MEQISLMPQYLITNQKNKILALINNSRPNMNKDKVYQECTILQITIFDNLLTTTKIKNNNPPL